MKSGRYFYSVNRNVLRVVDCTALEQVQLQLYMIRKLIKRITGPGLLCLKIDFPFISKGLRLFLVFFAEPWYTRPMEQYQLIRSRRKTLALEITEDCRVVVRAPRTLSRAQIDACVESHAAWIESHLKIQRERAHTRPPAPTEDEIAALKAQAWSILPPKIAFWSEKMGVTPTGLRITTARHRYGSCSGKNSLCFSCFLMNCPDAAIELVVVHELCHILEKNHGPGFYALLGRYLPDYKERRSLLR